MRIISALFVALLIAGAAPALAGGPESPMLLQADPQDGAKLQKAPDRITLTFDEPLDQAYSRIQVYDQCGRRADKGGATVTATQLSIALTRKPAGRYKVYYVANAYPKGATGETSAYMKFSVAKGSSCS